MADRSITDHEFRQHRLRIQIANSEEWKLLRDVEDTQEFKNYVEYMCNDVYIRAMMLLFGWDPSFEPDYNFKKYAFLMTVYEYRNPKKNKRIS